MKKITKGSILQSIIGVAAAVVCGAPASYADTFTDMISPVTNPVNFEDPRAITEARLIYAFHELDNDFITQGGDIQIMALQLRWALTDRFAIIATKDGYIWTNPDAVLTDEEGFGNIAAGAKYAFYKNDATGTIATAALRYEVPTGDEEVLQGNGDGILQPSVSAAFKFCEHTTMMTSADLRIPMSGNDSMIFDADVHFDYRVDTDAGSFYPLVEFNVMQVLDAGNRLAIADEGQDYFNLGASGSEDKTLVTAAAGARYRLTDSLDIGAAYQIPLTSGAGSRIIDWRVTTDMIYRF
jgi:hypothetical protein